MATEYLYLDGTVKWAKVYEEDKDKQYNNWSLSLYPSKESLSKIEDSPLQLKRHRDDDGVFFKFRRDSEKLIKGDLVTFDPPKVLLATGDVDENGVPVVEPFDKKIGNGSKVMVKVSIYQGKKGAGHRLEAVRVDEHVEYTKGPSEPTPDMPF